MFNDIIGVIIAFGIIVLAVMRNEEEHLCEMYITGQIGFVELAERILAIYRTREC